MQHRPPMRISASGVTLYCLLCCKFDVRNHSFCRYPWLPCVKGNSSRCEEMSRSDRGDRRRQRLPSEARLRERKGKAFMYLKPFSPSVTTYAVTPSRLPPRSVLLLRRGVRRTPAPKHRGGNFLLFTRKGRLSVLRLPLFLLYRRRRKGGNSPRRIFRSPRPVFRLSAFHLKAGQSTPSLSYRSGI